MHASLLRNIKQETGTPMSSIPAGEVQEAATLPSNRPSLFDWLLTQGGWEETLWRGGRGVYLVVHGVPEYEGAEQPRYSASALGAPKSDQQVT